MNTNLYPRKILVIDNDVTVTKFIENQLIKISVNCVTTNQAASAFYLFKNQIIDCVMVSFDLEEYSGLVMLQKLQALDQELQRGFMPILMVGKSFPAESQSLMQEFGDVGVLNKPVSGPKLLTLLQKRQQDRMNQQSMRETNQIIDSFINQNKFDKALATLKQNLSSYGKEGPRAMANVLEKMEQYQESLQIHKQRETKDPDNLATINDLGRVNMKLGNFKEAQKYFEKADAKAPQNLQRINDMAAMYLHLNHPEKTIDKYKEIMGVTPEDPDIKFGMIQELKDKGYEDQAANFCSEVAEPIEMIRFYNNKGVLLAKEDKLEEAIEEYKKAVEFFPDYKEGYRIYFNIALAYMRIGGDHREDIVRYLQECLRINPEYEKAKTHLDQVMSKPARKKAKSKSS